MFDQRFLDQYADTLQQVVLGLDTNAFLSRFQTAAWENMELKQRVSYLDQVTDEVLPNTFDSKVAAIKKIIDLAKEKGARDQNFVYIFLADIVSRHGIRDIEKAIPAIEMVTSFTSFEFAGRVFFIHHPEKMMAQMVKWAHHPNPNVRRYASEGCRPRLPWGLQLKQFVQNPAPIIPVLEALKNDPSEYVRKSVANNLNDISKDHPDLVLDILERWQKNASANTKKLIKQAARTLLKKGNTRALSLFGNFNHVPFTVKHFTVQPTTITLGDKLEFTFTVQNTHDNEANFRVEYFVYFVKANRQTQKKIFKVAEPVLSANQEKSFTKSHAFADLTTRKHYPGEHYLSIVVNGQEGEKYPVMLLSNTSHS